MRLNWFDRLADTIFPTVPNVGNETPAVGTGMLTLISGEDQTNNVLKVEQRVLYTNLSASALVKTGTGRLFGFIVNSHSSGTLKLWDNTAGSGGVLLNTITFAAGPVFVPLPFAVEFTTGLYATVGGTIDLTIFWK